MSYKAKKMGFNPTGWSRHPNKKYIKLGQLKIGRLTIAYDVSEYYAGIICKRFNYFQNGLFKTEDKDA
jgi:hypothetical protein